MSLYKLLGLAIIFMMIASAAELAHVILQTHLSKGHISIVGSVSLMFMIMSIVLMYIARKGSAPR